jgi:hypothetical protein
MKDGPDGRFELSLLALRGRRTQLDKAKGGQPEDASPTTDGDFRRRCGDRRDGDVGPGALPRRGCGRRRWRSSCLTGPNRGPRRGRRSWLLGRRRGSLRWRRRARRGSGTRRARRGSGSRRRARPGQRRRRRARRGGPVGKRGRSRGRGLGIYGVGTGRACSRGAGPVGPQTVPQEFVALVHGLLGCQAIGRRACGRPRRAPQAGEPHGPTTNAGCGPVSVQYLLTCRRWSLNNIAQTRWGLLRCRRNAFSRALSTQMGDIGRVAATTCRRSQQTCTSRLTRRAVR